MRLSRKGKIISSLVITSLAIGAFGIIHTQKAKASAPAMQKNPVVFVGGSSSNFEPIKGYMEDKGWSGDRLYELNLNEDDKNILSKDSLTDEYVADYKTIKTSDGSSSSKDSFKGGCSTNGCSANSSAKGNCSASGSFSGGCSANQSTKSSYSANTSANDYFKGGCSSNSSCSKVNSSCGKNASSNKSFSGKSIDKFFSNKAASDKFSSNSNANSDKLKSFINKILKETGSDKVDIIAHGLGGADTLNYLSNLNGAKNVGKVITLGGANALGAEKAPANVDITSIFSLIDSLVNNNLSKIDGADNMEVSDVSHGDLLSSNNILSMIVKLLSNSAGGGCDKSSNSGLGSGLSSILSLFGL